MKKRNKRIEIAVTDDEYQQLQERKTKPRLAEWLRELALGQKPKRQPKSIDPALLFELNRIGVNLNQIARHCHQAPVSMETVNIALALRHIEAQLREVLDRAD
ncbi:MobC family plasmid mobilization relaxosome protein [Proteus mirabilis]|uniref:MobC family plasmid mobilization relaxosome protein n=1 Tax=Proteus mirabilis TaxID=584 RepID=UPI0005131BE5|nr:MobC family plasmid mobilization relaxosome protein [Proteus mirabilis]KGH46360.1 mobilization protein [Acinetobacter idrijaensis]MDC5893138.1 MobC family plasmid mobilization relaxosome protein [Proteus mirabilis]MDC5914273.1 MobC family plasmid mobilization relaxosome protein [Proteus mirabilis]MDC6006216.1 MobC family plasmid mobilization relaxosome protein [Proteus mirabilis]HCC0196306.1 plasmid mobilization relaxosome protein MobC [Proteus mirabilis]